MLRPFGKLAVMSALAVPATPPVFAAPTVRQLDDDV